MLRNLQLLTKVVSNSSAFTRNLYSASALGLENYVTIRERVRQQFSEENESKFREKMVEYSEDKPGNMIFTEDLKNITHLIQNTPDDLELISKMLIKYNSQNKENRFGLFVFGPVILRSLYHVNAVDQALELFRNPKMEGFFDQLASFQILLDLLYENKRYQDVLDVFDEIRSKQIQGGRYPKHSVVLAFAACYKLNNEKSFEFATKLWKDCTEVGHPPMRKAATFAAGLALQQNQPQIALEIMSTIKDQAYVTVRNLKVIAYAKLDRTDSALPIVKSVLAESEPVFKKKTFIRAAIEELKKSVTKNNEKEYEKELTRVEKILQKNGQITEDSLDTILCTEIEATVQSNKNQRNRSVVSASFRNDSKNPNRQQRTNRQQNYSASFAELA